MLFEKGQPPRELNRLDIKNRLNLPAAAEERILRGLTVSWPALDALVVLDQVGEANCGVVTDRVRERLAILGRECPDKLILADSRERIGKFRFVSLKPNRKECVQAVSTTDDNPQELPRAAWRLACRVQRPVFCTAAEKGILLAQPSTEPQAPVFIPAYPVSSPIDSVGAGDSTSAGIACAVAAGASLSEAAAFGNLIASITIQQIGSTGTASPEQVRQRWLEVRSA